MHCWLLFLRVGLSIVRLSIPFLRTLDYWVGEVGLQETMGTDMHVRICLRFGILSGIGFVYCQHSHRYGWLHKELAKEEINLVECVLNSPFEGFWEIRNQLVLAFILQLIRSVSGHFCQTLAGVLFEEHR